MIKGTRQRVGPATSSPAELAQCSLAHSAFIACLVNNSKQIHKTRTVRVTNQVEQHAETPQETQPTGARGTGPEHEHCWPCWSWLQHSNRDNQPNGHASNQPTSDRHEETPPPAPRGGQHRQTAKTSQGPALVEASHGEKTPGQDQ